MPIDTISSGCQPPMIEDEPVDADVFEANLNTNFEENAPQ